MYTILSTQVAEDTLNTEVEYTFTDGEKDTIIVSSFRPDSMETVISNIEQREVSEQAKRDAKKLNEAIAKELEKIIE